VQGIKHALLSHPLLKSTDQRTNCPAYRPASMPGAMAGTNVPFCPFAYAYITTASIFYPQPRQTLSGVLRLPMVVTSAAWQPM
jgi:hypothetical protein